MYPKWLKFVHSYVCCLHWNWSLHLWQMYAKWYFTSLYRLKFYTLWGQTLIKLQTLEKKSRERKFWAAHNMSSRILNPELRIFCLIKYGFLCVFFCQKKGWKIGGNFNSGMVSYWKVQSKSYIPSTYSKHWLIV